MKDQSRMKLTIGDFYVKDIVFGQKTGYKDGILTVNKEEAISVINPGGKLKNIDLEIARPGESVRILPIKAAVEARARVDGRATFPGYTGKMARCGDGELFALKNMCVMAVGKYGGWMEGIVDMSGPGAQLTNYADVINLCFVAENVDPNEDKGQHMNLAYREGAHLLAQYLGKTALGQEPDEWENYELTDASDKKLPRVALVMLLSTFYEKAPGFDDVFYGVDVLNLVPTLVHPNEVLDGALCSSALVPAGGHNSTYDYQNFPIIKKLCREHGKTIDFAGVIFANIGPTIEKKERAAIRIAEIASLLHCDGAIYSQQSDGNPDIDFFKAIIALEEKGIKTVGVCGESPGHDGTTQAKVMLDERADAIVSTGSISEVVELPAMERTIGDLQSLIRDPYPGAWADDAVYGPSLRPDGSIVIDTDSYLNDAGMAGWSYKTCKDF